MKAPTMRRICAQSDSSFGSKTTHLVPRNKLSSMNSANLHTGMYFQSDACSSAPARVRAPHTTGPAVSGKDRRQLTPCGVSSPFSRSVRSICSP